MVGILLGPQGAENKVGRGGGKNGEGGRGMFSKSQVWGDSFNNLVIKKLLLEVILYLCLDVAFFLSLFNGILQSDETEGLIVSVI